MDMSKINMSVQKRQCIKFIWISSTIVHILLSPCQQHIARVFSLRQVALKLCFLSILELQRDLGIIILEQLIRALHCKTV